MPRHKRREKEREKELIEGGKDGEMSRLGQKKSMSELSVGMCKCV